MARKSSNSSSEPEPASRAQIDARINEIQSELKALQASRVDSLREELRAAQAVVRKVEAQIAELLGTSAAEGKGPRKRLRSEEVSRRIHAVVADAGPVGISQKEISVRTGIVYATVAKYLKEHASEFKKVGERKTARFYPSGKK